MAMLTRPVDQEEYHNLLRQSRLAEPPLVGAPHLTAAELATFAPQPDAIRPAEAIQMATQAIVDLCDALRPEMSRLGLRVFEGRDRRHSVRLPETDVEWLCDMLNQVASGLEKQRREHEMPYARALDAKLRGDIEYGAPHIRTIGGFVIQTLQMLHDKVEKEEAVSRDFLWKEVASLQFISVDMVAWVAYCDAPKKQTWASILNTKDAPTTPTSLRYGTSNQRIAHHRGFHLQARREFQVGARRQDSSLSDQYDKLLNAYPHVY